MTHPLSTRVAGAALAALLGATLTAGAVRFEQNFDGFDDGTTDLGDGTTIADNQNGTTANVQGGALNLTLDGVNSTRSSYRIPQIDGSSEGWTATFDFVLSDSAGANPPADGVSFNYGAIPPYNPAAPVGAADGHGAAEEGFGIGLSIEFDTWMNGDAEVGYNVAVDNVDVPDGFINTDILADGATLEGTATLTWSPADGVTVTIDTGDGPTDLFTNLATPGFSGDDSYIFAFSARTGGANETLTIDNLVIDTVGMARDPKIVIPGQANAGTVDTNGAVDFAVTVENVGPSQNLNVTDAVLSGADADHFSVLSLPDPIAPGTTGEIMLRVEGLGETGTLQALLTVTNDDSSPVNQSREVTLVATAIIPQVPFYQQDFTGIADGTDDLGDGTVIASNDGTARVVGEALVLTADLVGNTRSSFRIPAVENSSGGWQATFNVFITDSADGSDPADGFSFNYGAIPPYDPNADIAAAEGHGLAEEGFQSVPNLSFEFDTWRVGDTEHGYNIAVDGVDVDGGTINTDVIVEGGEFIGTATLEWTPERGASMTIDTGDGPVPLFEGLETPGFDGDDFHTFAFSARTGGAHEDLIIDDLLITTDYVPRDPKLRVVGDLNFGPMDVGATREETIVLHNRGQAEDLVIDGANLTGPNAANFAILNNLPLTIAAGESADLMVRAAALADLGAISATLTLVSNDGEPTLQERVVDLRAAVVPGQVDGVYTQSFEGFDDGTTDLGDGSLIGSSDGTASVQGGALRLTQDDTNSTRASFRIPPLPNVPGGAIDSFSVTFGFSLFDAEGGNPPADGFSFNFGAIPEFDAGAGAGGPSGHGGAEEGFGIGLSVEFDTWNNSAGEAGYNVAVDGVDVPDGFVAGPPPVDGNFHFVEIRWTRDAGDPLITVTVDGEPIFLDLPTPGFDPQVTDSFAFSARTGGANETLLIDSLIISSPATAAPERDPRIRTDSTLSLGSVDPLGTAQGTLTIFNDGVLQNLVIADDSGFTGPDAGSFNVVTPLPLTIPPGGSSELVIEATGGLSFGRASATLTLNNNDSLDFAQALQVALSFAVAVPGGNYAQDFDGFADGTTVLGDSSTIASTTGSAMVVGGALQLTSDATGSTNAMFFVPPLGQPATQAFRILFDYVLSDGEGNNNPADGFSVSYGRISDTQTGGEEGFGTGLSVEFDTWNLGDAELGYNVAVDGADLAHINENVIEDGESRSGTIEIFWFRTGDDTGLITVTMSDEDEVRVLFEDLETTGFDPQADYVFAFAARTGGATEDFIIDNLLIESGSEDPNIIVSGRGNFGVLQSDQGTATQSISIRNTGQTNTLNLASVTLDPPDGAGGVFSITSAPANIPPNSSGAIEITADPSLGTGLVTAQLVINSDDPSTPEIRLPLSVSVPLNPDLVLHLPLDETAGSAAQDFSGNGLAGNVVLPGAANAIPGQPGIASGTAYRLESASDTEPAYIDLPDIPATQNITISMWINQDPADVGTVSILAAKTGDPSPYAFAIHPALGLIWVVGEEFNNLELGAGTIVAGQDHHIVVTHEDNNGTELGAARVAIYVDGQLAGSADNPDGFTDVTGQLQIGAQAGAIGFIGLIDDIQIYRRALTAAEVAFLFQNPGQTVGEGPTGPLDSDGDGLSDDDENAVGTDPNDANSRFAAFNTGSTTAPGAGLTEFRFSVPGNPAFLFRIEFKADLGAPTWTEVTTVVGGSDFQDTDAARLGGRAGFYRIVLVGPAPL